MELKKGSLTSGIFVALGSNLGDRLVYLRNALTALESRGIKILQLSPVYESAAWGKEPSDYEQPAYLNAVAEVETSLSAEALLETLLETENQLGRERPYRWAPRTLDLDLLYYHQQIIDSPRLQLPHPRIAERRFVLQPLCDLAPHFLHPLLQLTQQELLARCADPGTLQRHES